MLEAQCLRRYHAHMILHDIKKKCLDNTIYVMTTCVHFRARVHCSFRRSHDYFEDIGVRNAPVFRLVFRLQTCACGWGGVGKG